MIRITRGLPTLDEILTEVRAGDYDDALLRLMRAEGNAEKTRIDLECELAERLHRDIWTAAIEATAPAATPPFPPYEVMPEEKI